MIALLFAALLPQQGTTVPASRFEMATPLRLPAITIDALNDGIGLAQQAARSYNLQGRVLWIDGTANIERCNTDAKIVELVQKIKSVGFNTIVYDVKPISGQVLYFSKIAPKIQSWKGKVLPDDFDPLAAMSRAAKKVGIELLISLNAFSEGHSLFKEGPGYSHPEWQSIIYDPLYVIEMPGEEAGETEWVPISPKLNAMPGDAQCAVFTDTSKIKNPDRDTFAVSVDRDGRVVDGFDAGGVGGGVPTVPTGGSVVIGRGKAADFLEEHAVPGEKLNFRTYAKFVPISARPDIQYPLMTNPNRPDVQARNLAIVEEILRNYPVNGILYDDRLRYGGLNADFSPLTTSLFEKHVGKKLLWPDDVFRYTISPTLTRGIRPGKYFDAWLAWRSEQMKQWVTRVGNTVHRVRKDAKFGIYAGSWYGDYQQFGNNYASPQFDGGFWFLTKPYQRTGFAPALDLLITGCYYTTPTIFDALQAGKPIGSTVEAAGQLSNRAARDATWSYAGISLDAFRGNPEGLANVLQAACASTQGVMVFDLSHDIEPMWPVFARAFARPMKAPHQVPGLLDAIRAKRGRYDAWGVKEPIVPISAGSSGVGF